MHDHYYSDLATQFIGNVLAVEPGENTWIEYCSPKAKILADACEAEVVARGGTPVMVDSSSAYINQVIKPQSPEELYAYGIESLQKMQKMQKYIRIKDDADQASIALTSEEMTAYKIAMNPQLNYRINNVRWLLIAAPTEEFAAKCNMDYAKFLEFYRNVCLTDYGSMSEAVKPLQKLMSEGKQVWIYSPEQETDLTFSIEGINAIPCTGEINIPDGECFTAPVKDSINGTIKFGPSVYEGKSYDFIKLRFESGRIVEAESDTPERSVVLNQMLDTDAGARYVGEFSLNFNPYILHPTGSILFDEEISGGLHMAMGQAYENAYNGNDSAVHWDMVQIQRPDYGGGEIWIDDVLIRKDGRFVLPELLPLNPENLMGALTELSSLPKPPAAARQRRP